ncbi:serine/threonine-protein kinase, partial [Zavarzinella formosa]|uniref:serine/threonine-protein kinase n=1 Tax=Zavarzinella formosa TaxID=360055 RepID=UPI00187D9E3D
APPDLAGHLAACRECRENFERQAMGDTGWLLDAARTTAIPAPPELMASLRGFCSPLTGETLARLETLPDVTVDELMPKASGQRHRIGPYEVLGVVGRGGMGIVLQGHDVVLRRTVALKIPALSMRGDSVARGRFLREGRAAASITHPNVVPVLAVEEYAGVPVLVMPFVHGESLQQRLDREGTVPPAEALRIGLETALALGAAHERGLVHRDVKPANILLESPAGNVRLTDFGLARAADDARLTQTGLGAGT